MRWLPVLIAVALPASAAAQGWIEPLPLPQPRPAPQMQRVERVRTSVTVRVTDRVARVEVEEWFRNVGGGVAEGDYIYPLAGEAVFSDFSLFQGEEELKGETMEAARARAIYEEIVRRRRDPALIEMAGHGLLRARVFPFGPGETRNVRLRYTQVLDRAGDALRFRYVAGTARPASTFQAATAASGDSTPFTFTLIADNGSRFGEPFSPTDRLQVTRDRDRLSVRPAARPAGSFDIFLPLAVPGVGVSLATHRVNGEDGYFMLTLSPGAVKAATEPRDLAIVVDVSGSMSGEKIEQARDALVQLLGSLNARDRFRLVAFGNQVQSFKPEWSDATRPNVDEARTWVDRLTAAGGTNIAGALDEALRTPGGTGRLHLAIVITDGQPTVGETDPERIAARVEAARGQARIFTFGVGHDLNTYLLDRMAVAGRGTVDYVEPGRTVEEAVGALANRIRLPVLVDLAFAGTPVRLRDVQPARLPDMYAGQELVVFGRYESTGTSTAGELAIEGRRSGKSERFAARVEFPAHAASGEYIPGLWAARKVGEMTRNIRLEGATPARIAEVRDLALRYGLLTEYTSYLVQEPVAFTLNGRARAGGGGGGGGTGRGGALAGQLGESAVADARLATRMIEAKTLDDLTIAQAVAVTAAAPAVDVQNARQLQVNGMTVNSGASSQIVAGRRFRLDSGVWVDAGHTAKAQVVTLEPFSPAYFAVLARLPELTPYWSAFEAVAVAGRQVSIRVAPGGQATLAASELESLVRNFRAQ